MQSAPTTPNRVERGALGVLGGLRAGILLREFPRRAIVERARAGTLWAEVPLEVVTPGAYSDHLVMHIAILKKNGELRTSLRAAMVSDLAESLGWIPTTRSPL